MPSGTPPTLGQLANGTLINQAFTSAAPTLDTKANGWVFGTELPRLEINEVYAEIINDPTDPKNGGKNKNAATKPFQVTFWAELHNPFNSDQTLPDSVSGQSSVARLQFPGPGGYSVYNLAIEVDPLVMGAYNADSNLQTDPANALGAPTSANLKLLVSSYTPDTGTTPTVDANIVLPSNGAFNGPNQGNAGFYVLGPGAKYPFPSTAKTPPVTATLQVMQQTNAGNPQAPSAMVYNWGMTASTVPSPLPKHALLLQRLACPYLPPQSSPSPANTYNPYITVDYVDQVPTNDAITADTAGPHTGTPIQSRASVGRMEPYAANATFQKSQNPMPADNTQPKNTLFRHNSQSNPPPAAGDANLSLPFDWLVHLDRQLVSPMELLQVSGFKPHRLTQQFAIDLNGNGIIDSNEKFLHRVYWFDEDFPAGANQSHRLYRVFEFLETGNRAAGMTPGGRIPGKVNISTVYDQEIFQAICAGLAPNSNPNPNYFDTGNVATIFSDPTNGILKLRSPGLATGGDGMLHAPVNSGITPPPGVMPDQPFLSLAAGVSATGDQQNPSGININNTLLRNTSAGVLPRMLQVTSFNGNQVTHPYLQDQLLTKIFNNLTTRSNVFAVFVTVGFFQVIDDTARPVKLGAEIGRAENRHIRHRMFAIVDRTNLATDKYNPNTIQPPPVYLVGSVPYPPPPAPPTPNTIAIPDGQLAAGGAGLLLTGTYEGIRWIIQPPSPGAFPTLGSNVVIDSGTNQEIVNVVAVNPASPPTIQTTPWTKAHAGPIAVTPVNTVTAYTQIQAGTGTPTTPVQIAVSAVNGQFQGVNWNFQVGTIILLDAGSSVPGTTPEPALIVSPPPVPPAQGQSGSITIQSLNAGGFQVHRPGPSGGYTISYPIPVGGNPGPQTNFDMRQVPWVVRHFSIIN
jgi:hypothetical protein